MKILYLGQSSILHPWYDDCVSALEGRHRICLYDPAQSMAQQFEEIDVVVDHGGSVGTREMMNAAAQNGVRLWQVLGTGLDHVDVAYILSKGLMLCNTPGLFSDIALAEHALFLMLMFAKNFQATQQTLKRGAICDPINQELAGQTLGLIGFGASARALARRAHGMEMRVRAIDAVALPQTLREEYQLEALGGREDLPELLGASDFVSLHTPLNPSTRHLIGREELAIMKPNAILLNVARGEIVDEEALLAALNAGRLGGAGLDVFSCEPIDPAHPLLQLDNVIATPHMAGVTNGTSRRRGEAVAENVERISQDKPPHHIISETP
jgi:D-3-phosphoglycerate dehydrogenase